MPVVTQIQVRRGTASQWTSTNPTLAAGEIGFETDTLRAKIGNGSTAWNSLAYGIGTNPLLTPTFTTNAYTLAIGDQGDILLASNGATAGTITIPTNATVGFPTGTQITIIQTGAGQLTIQGAGGVTVNSTGATTTAPKLRAQNSSATCIKTDTNTWYVVGDIS
jgi:hypothetical protein